MALFALSNRRAFSLADVRRGATKLYTAIAWLHVPAAAIIALISRNGWSGPAAALAIVAALATICARTLKDGPLLRCIMAVAITLGPVVFVYAARGAASGISGTGDWQVDYHMYFFAVFAMLVGYVDWRPIVVSALVTAGHHVLLDLIAPANVFPEEGLDRVALHALCVVAECSVLIWIVNTVAALFHRIDDLMEYTTKATAEAIAAELDEKALLVAELERLRASA
jgi:hypothetical protein